MTSTSVRLDGDMFVVLIDGCDHRLPWYDAYTLRDKISECLDELVENIDVYSAYEANGW